MSKLRPEAGAYRGDRKALPDETALFLIRDSVARRNELIYGRLHDGKGRHCAIGAMWEDNPTVLLNPDLIDEVATVNDSVGPEASARERWKKVNSWIRWKIRILAQKAGK